MKQSNIAEWKNKVFATTLESKQPRNHPDLVTKDIRPKVHQPVPPTSLFFILHVGTGENRAKVDFPEKSPSAMWKPK